MCSVWCVPSSILECHQRPWYSCVFAVFICSVHHLYIQFTIQMCPYAMWSVKCLTIILTHHGSGRTTKNHTTQTNPQSPPALCSVAVSPNLIIEEDEKLHGNWRFRRCSRRTAIALSSPGRGGLGLRTRGWSDDMGRIVLFRGGRKSKIEDQLTPAWLPSWAPTGGWKPLTMVSGWAEWSGSGHNASGVVVCAWWRCEQ